MVAMMRYTVTAERGAGPVWVFQCVEHPGAISESKRLSEAVTLMPEAIAFVAGVSESDVEVEVHVELSPSIEGLLADATSKREESERLARAASEEIRKTAKLLSADHYSMRDIGEILGVSHQRVAQIVNA